ncbi:hypothetical protein Vretimale_9685, partial [Volvox reticuliferus]
ASACRKTPRGLRLASPSSSSSPSSYTSSSSSSSSSYAPSTPAVAVFLATGRNGSTPSSTCHPRCEYAQTTFTSSWGDEKTSCRPTMALAAACRKRSSRTPIIASDQTIRPMGRGGAVSRSGIKASIRRYSSGPGG